MDIETLYDLFATKAIVIALASLRLTVAFLVTPLFTEELIPPLIRNSVFIVLAIVVAFVQPPIDFGAPGTAEWIALFAKEVFIGIAIGFFLSIFLWAFEAAGIIIDTQIGTSMAMIYDPISGHEVTLYGDFIGRWINYLFLASGGMLFLTVAIIESYATWPIDRVLPDLRAASMLLFEDRFSAFVALTLTVAAPIVVAVFIIDMCMGLMNRFAKRLDILFVSMAIKGLVTVLMMIAMVPVLVDALYRQLASNRDGLETFLRQVLGVLG